MGDKLAIGIISPWKVRCGIATYTEHLAKALADLDHKIYIVRLHRFGRRSVEYFQTLAARRIPKCQILSVQHEYGLYDGGEGFFYSTLRSQHQPLPVATTMHATGNPAIDGVVYESSDLVIVHNDFCLRRLDREAKVIPHGVESWTPAPLRESREKLGLEVDRAVVVLFGFIGPYKNYELALRVMGLEFPDVQLLVAGGWHVQTDTPYIEGLKHMANNLCPGQAKWMGWVADEELPYVFGAGDVCLYPNKFISESGALLTMVGFGKCVLAGNLAPNREKEPKDALFCFENEADLIRKLERLLTDPELRHRYEEGARRYSEEWSWSNVANMHLNLYEEIL